MTAAGQNNRFTVVAPLGRGGTAEVHRVRLSDSGREAALKTPLPSDSYTDSDFATLARREYELIGGHRFPGLVRLLEPAHTEPDYLLLELCEGPTVDVVGRIDAPMLALNLMCAIALSMEYLRARGIIHGDLKPQNIFLPRGWDRVRPGRLWYAKISDFSLGRKIDEPESARAGLGTVGFMAPEVIAQKTTSHQSDLFALGVIAYQILTGQHPFLVGDCEPVKVNSRIQEETPIPIERLRPDLAGHPVIQIVDSLLAKEASARPKTASAVCKLLEQAGAEYPYERGIRPRHLWNENSSAEQVLKTIDNLNNSDQAQLQAFTGDDPSSLREVISGNWAVGNLNYVEGRFCFVSGVRWPAFLRQRQLVGYRQLTLSAKKILIAESAAHAENQAGRMDAPLLTLLRQLVKAPTLRRVARRQAPQIERDADFIRATMVWLTAGELVAAERCALQAATSLTKADCRPEALALANRVIDLARTTGRLQEVSELLLLSGTLLKDSGDTAGAESIYAELIADLAAKPVSKTLGIVYNKLGDLYKMRSDFETGREALEKALSIFEQLDDRLEYSHTCNNLGNIYWVKGDLAKSAQYLRRALRVQRKLNVREDIASTLSNLGSILCISGKIPRGLYLMRESLTIKREIGNAGEIARTLNNLGYVSYMSGDNAKAVGYLSESLEMNRRAGSRKEILINIENLTSIMISAGQLGKSLALVREGLTLSREIGDAVQEILLQVSLATALIRLGKLGEAKAVLAEVAAKSGTADDPAIGVVYRCAAAELEIVLGRFDRATQFAREARAVSTVDPFVKLRAVLLTARLEKIDGMEREVEELAAQTQFDRLRIMYFVNRAEQSLREDDFNTALEAISRNLDSVAKMEDEIEAPRLNTVIAEVLLANGRKDEALASCRRARILARQFGSTLDLFSIGVLAGRLHFEAGDYEQSFREYRQTIAVAKEIASTLTDQQDRIDFQNRREIKFIVGEIERLGLILGQKKAGRSEPARA